MLIRLGVNGATNENSAAIMLDVGKSDGTFIEKTLLTGDATTDFILDPRFYDGSLILSSATSVCSTGGA